MNWGGSSTRPSADSQSASRLERLAARKCRLEGMGGVAWRTSPKVKPEYQTSETTLVPFNPSVLFTQRRTRRKRNADNAYKVDPMLKNLVSDRVWEDRCQDDLNEAERHCDEWSEIAEASL
jgi:hypothetical protein